jgi:hypothetical protein
VPNPAEGVAGSGTRLYFSRRSNPTACGFSVRRNWLSNNRLRGRFRLDLPLLLRRERRLSPPRLELAFLDPGRRTKRRVAAGSGHSRGWSWEDWVPQVFARNRTRLVPLGYALPDPQVARELGIVASHLFDDALGVLASDERLDVSGAI